MVTTRERPDTGHEPKAKLTSPTLEGFSIDLNEIFI